MFVLLLTAVFLILKIQAEEESTYKILLNQLGNEQFLKYDVVVPPLREFTFCTWIRLFDLDRDQSIFAYIANRNSILEIWTDSGGENLKVSFNGRKSSSPISWIDHTWHHICVSYQSQLGAWAIYVDGKLLACEAVDDLLGYVLPGGGSIFVGYTFENTEPQSGLRGEIFGFHMILLSTIEKNIFTKYGERKVHKNKVKYGHHSGIERPNTSIRDFQGPMTNNSFRNYIRLNTLHSIDHDVSIHSPFKISDNIDLTAEEKEIFDLPLLNENIVNERKPKINFWHIVNKAGHEGKFKKQEKSFLEQTRSGTEKLPSISLYETPPPAQINYSFHKNIDLLKLPIPTSLKSVGMKEHSDFISISAINSLSEIETPPPPTKDNSVYGHWTGAKFAGNVLNYLKSINYYNKQPKNVPPTIPLTKISESYPYSSNINTLSLRPPKLNRRSIIEHVLKGVKRDIHDPEINVQIIEDNVRETILKLHAQTQPKEVVIISRGESEKFIKPNLYKNFSQESRRGHLSKTYQKPRPFSANGVYKNHKVHSTTSFDTLESNNLLSVLPFLNVYENPLSDAEKNKPLEHETKENMYTNSLSNTNKWHNVKSYSSNNTARQIKTIRNGNINNFTEYNLKISLSKPNRNFRFYNKTGKSEENQLTSTNKNNFNKPVKIGNALNERDIIGSYDDDKQRSFIGGNEKVPDIQRYRSVIDNTDHGVPPSLQPKICETFDELLLDKIDGGNVNKYMDLNTKGKYVAMYFILKSYKSQCSVNDMVYFQFKKILFIDWKETTVGLYGGAMPKEHSCTI